MRVVSKNVLMILILLFSGISMVVQAAGAPVGRVVWVKGNFVAVSGQAKRSLERAGIFYVNDTLITDASSQAQIVFSDNSLMTLREGTRFRVDQYNLKANGGGSYVMSLVEGGFRTVTGAIAANNPSGYQIKTPVATIGVRGTEFIAYYKNGRLYVGRIKGRPCIFDRIKRIQICLTPQMPYVVILAGEGSEGLSEMPDELNDSYDLTIVPAMIQPNPPGGKGPGGPGGQVSSFCVQ